MPGTYPVRFAFETDGEFSAWLAICDDPDITTQGKTPAEAAERFAATVLIEPLIRADIERRKGA